MIEPSAKFEEIKIPLREPVHGLTEVSGILGVPEWWPTGARVAIVLAHGANSNLDDPLLGFLQRELTERKFLTLRFNFPFAEAGKRASADSREVLVDTLRAAIAVLGRDPTAAPARLFVAGMGIGARAAAELATEGLRADGLIFLGYPLHPQNKPEKAAPDPLYRIIVPMLFIQGLRDRTCDVETLRRCLARVGAPATLNLLEDADAQFRVTKRSGIDPAQMRAAVLQSMTKWIEERLATE